MGKERSPKKQRKFEEEREELDERVIDIARVAKVIKGGRRFAFRTVVVVGDGKGRLGIGVGKARGVPDSIRKASDRARRSMKQVSIFNETIPYEVTGKWAGAKVLLKPASPGTGVLAGGSVRAVLEAAGIHNILTKSQGSNNMLNVAMATFNALQQLRSPEMVAAMRGKDVEDVLPFWERARIREERRALGAVKARQQTERQEIASMPAGEQAASSAKAKAARTTKADETGGEA